MPPRCSHAKSLISAGHALLDDTARCTRDCGAGGRPRFTMLCHPYMDVTGGRGETARAGSRLLSSKSAAPPTGSRAAATVLELGAGMGDRARAREQPGLWRRADALYGDRRRGPRRGHPRPRRRRGLGHVLRASTLCWGAAVETEYDLVVVCGALHWKGDLPDDEDIVPLARRSPARASAGARPSPIACACRRARRDSSSCAAQTGCVGACPDGAAALAPPEAEQLDGGSRGAMRLVIMCDAALSQYERPIGQVIES